MKAGLFFSDEAHPKQSGEIFWGLGFGRAATEW